MATGATAAESAGNGAAADAAGAAESGLAAESRLLGVALHQLRQERDGNAALRSLELYPAQGCCTSVGEVLPDVQAVAVPLGRIDRGEIAAINVSFQRRSLNERWLVEEVAPMLLALARRLV